MKPLLGLILILLLAGCQTANITSNITILDGDRLIRLDTSETTPSRILYQAGIQLGAQDQIETRGTDIPLDIPLPVGGSYILQIRQAHSITIQTPNGPTAIQSTAGTVGETLREVGIQIGTADFVAPSLSMPILSNMTITYRPAQELKVTTGGVTTRIKSAQPTVGKALAAAGLALSALDESQPADQDALPDNGLIKIVRVSEAVTLAETQIPFTKKYVYSPALAVGEQSMVQAGAPGLKLSRVRTRFEDGQPVSKITESESIVQQPIASVISLGSQISVQTLDTPGGQVEYWRAVQMYATSYSPCGSGTPKCSYGTASGLPVKQGVVALVPSLYNQLAGSKVYIPGYGIAVVGDVGGGFPDGRLWIDLAYSDSDYQSWAGMVTVYFLVPAPASIPAGLQ